MAGRLLATLVTAAVAGVVALPGAAAAPSAAPTAAPAGSVNDWQRGQWWVDATKLTTWHQQGITGKGVTVALLDGPVATGIPELQGQDVEPTATLCDRDLWRSWGPTTPDGPLDDTSFHTTSMAALIVGNGKGNGPGGVGVLGVAPGATLKTYAMFNTVDPAAHQNLDCWGPGLAAFIDRIVADGAQVIQIPVSFDVENDEIQAAFNRAITKGVVVVAASGNGGASAKVMSPGGNAGVLVVGGMQPDGKVLETNPTSTLDSWDQARTFDVQYNIHLVAPGADLVGGGLAPGNRWDSAVLQSGSSGASAIVAGQLALMKQKWPRATGNQLIYSLLRNARHPDGSAEWEPRRGFGTTSFEATLTTDPTAYPDVMPIYASMGNVVSDQPTPPFIPLQVGGDGRLPEAPTPAPAQTAGAGATVAAAPAAPAVSTTSDTAWLVWLVCGLVAVGLVVGGGWALTRNRPARPDLRAERPEGAGRGAPRPETARQVARGAPAWRDRRRSG
ncbi:MAG TPA: S8/S53 family peptidase [Lapillicoccus sp.]|nr:S8/S53 family peptidase [Lapillicoccus sp.]